jgi:hypothetical protein
LLRSGFGSDAGQPVQVAVKEIAIGDASLWLAVN